MLGYVWFCSSLEKEIVGISVTINQKSVTYISHLVSLYLYIYTFFCRHRYTYKLVYNVKIAFMLTYLIF